MRNLYPGATGPVGAPPVPNSHHSRAAAAAAAAGYTHYSHANNLSHMSRYPQVGKYQRFFALDYNKTNTWELRCVSTNSNTAKKLRPIIVK